MKTSGKKIIRDDRVTDYLLPLCIKAVEGNHKNITSLLTEKLPQIGLNEPDCAEFLGAGYVILDFGTEISGGIRILTHKVSGNSKIRIRFGESLSETCSKLKGTSDLLTATNDHGLRDFETNLVFLSDMRFGETGFRFVRIDFFEDAVITIKSIYAAYQHRDLKRCGTFKCSDSVVNKIFDTAAHTVELCMQNRLWDGIKRDRLVWIGDTHPEMLSIVSLFGADKCVEDALSFARNEASLPNFMNNIPSYSLWWLIIVADYYIQNGDDNFIKSEGAYIKGLIQLIDSYVNSQGEIEFDYFFLDWATAEKEERFAGVYALCVMALNKTKITYRVLHEDPAVLDSIINRLNRNLDGGTCKQVNAMRVLAGIASPNDVLSLQLEGGAKGMSTFMSYYILVSIAMAGKTTDALKIMREYYDGMLSRGATTFWEDFDIDWLNGSGRIDEFIKLGQKDIHGDYGAYCYKGFRHSLCHGWASGPVPFLMHYILGIQVVEPGCKTIRFQPDLCGLEYAKGTYPTPYGIIEVELTQTKAIINTSKDITVIK